MKKLSLVEAAVMLENKRGAGVSKHTKVRLDMDIEFDSGVPAAKIFVETLSGLISLLAHHQSIHHGYSLKNTTIKDKSFVETELENNPDWNLKESDKNGMTESEKEEVRRDHIEGDDLGDKNE